MARLHDIVFDCAHPASLARFWAAALDGYAVAPYDDAEIGRLATLGITDTEDDPTVLVEARRPLPRFWFQRVPEARTVKNRVHLDLTSTDPDAERARLVALGARVAEVQPDDGWWVMHDPEGNDLCLLRSPHSDRAP
jgi:hypothetical protein